MKKFIFLMALSCIVMSGKSQTCPDDKHPHAIDLGLPSGIKWACCNMGAKSPEDYGAYFAFGESQEKDVFEAKNYTNVNYQYGEMFPRLDPSTISWGETWHTPSPSQFDELKTNCTSEWKTVKGVNGRLFTGKNGNSIFMPAAGKIIKLDNASEGNLGQYWLNTEYRYGGTMDKAYYLFFSNTSVNSHYCLKCFGLSMRPVMKEIE